MLLQMRQEKSVNQHLCNLFSVSMGFGLHQTNHACILRFPAMNRYSNRHRQHIGNLESCTVKNSSENNFTHNTSHWWRTCASSKVGWWILIFFSNPPNLRDEEVSGALKSLFKDKKSELDALNFKSTTYHMQAKEIYDLIKEMLHYAKKKLKVKDRSSVVNHVVSPSFH